MTEEAATFQETRFSEGDGFRFAGKQRVLRIFFLLLGGLFGAIALWIFYVRPWLGGVSRMDRWFDEHRCAIRALCAPTFELPSQPGMLAALLAILFFGLALWHMKQVWEDRLPDTIDYFWSWATGRAWLILASLAIGVTAVGIQAVQTLSGQTPHTFLWLTGIAAFVLVAALWDAEDLASLQITLADLLVALAMAITVIGSGGLLAGKLLGLLLTGLGVLVFGVASWWSQRAGSSLGSREHVMMLVLSLVALLLAMSRAWSWRFAFIGDEWNFYEVARAYIHRPEHLNLLSLRSLTGYFSVFSSALQAWVMVIAGETVFGWRLSSVLPFVLSVGPVYVVLRWLAGRLAAFLGTGLFVGSHVLLGFTMIPYNNTQALVPLTLGLGLFAFAHQAQRASVLRYLLVGVALGLGFFVYGLARLVVLPLGILLLAFAWPLRRAAMPGWVPAIFGCLAMGAPMLFNLANWRTMLNATPVESEVAAGFAAVGLQIAYNALRGSTAFMAGARNTHFVVGPHLDLLTVLLVLAGLGFAVSSIRSSKYARTWIASSGIFVLAVSAIQQYGLVSNARMFILVPIYIVYAGVGGAAILQLVFPGDRLVRAVFAGMLVVAGLALNVMHLDRITLPNSYWPLQTLLVEQLQTTSALDRGGMPVFIVTTSPYSLESRIVRAYDVGRERLIFLSAEEALQLPHLCQSGDRRAMLLVDPRISQIDLLRQRIADCWAGSREDVVPDQDGRSGLLRFVTRPAQDELRRPVVERSSQREAPDTLMTDDPSEVVAAPDGSIYVLSRQQGRVFRFSSEGEAQGSIAIMQNLPWAMTWSPEGLLVVASVGTGSRLVWYRPDGTVAREAPVNLDLGVPRGLAAAANGEILVADTGGSRVVRLSPDGQVISQLTGTGRVQRPASVLADRDGSVWVLNASGELLHISLDDQVLGSLTVPPTSPEDGWRLAQVPNGDLVLAQPEDGRVVQRTRDGELVRIWSGFDRPIGLTVDPGGRLIVADVQLEEIGILPPFDR